MCCWLIFEMQIKKFSLCVLPIIVLWSSPFLLSQEQIIPNTSSYLETLNTLEDVCPDICSKEKSAWSGKIKQGKCACQSPSERLEKATHNLNQMCTNKCKAYPCKTEKGDWTGNFDINQGCQCRCPLDGSSLAYVPVNDDAQEPSVESPVMPGIEETAIFEDSLNTMPANSPYGLNETILSSL